MFIVGRSLLERNPTLFRVLTELRPQLGELKACWRELELEHQGFSYESFDQYMNGRVEIHGRLLGLLVDHIGWVWAWELGTDERFALAESVLKDPHTPRITRLRALSLCLGLFRQTGDIAGHARKSATLELQFPLETFPCEHTLIRHEQALVGYSTETYSSGMPGTPTMVIDRWLDVRNCLKTAEAAGFWDLDLHVAVMRDIAMALAALVGPPPPEDDRFRWCLVQAQSDLAECEPQLLCPAGTCYHWAAVVRLEAALQDFARAQQALERLHAACSALGPPDNEFAAGIWARYDLAVAFVGKQTNDVEAQRKGLAHASKRLQMTREYRWEQQIRRELEAIGCPKST